MKYIIKNCPAFCDVDDDWNCINRDTEELKCQNYTDCLLKRIVEKCGQYKKDYITTNGVWLLANKISSMLEIEECEE